MVVSVPPVVEGPFQQTDLPLSLAWQFGSMHCRSTRNRSFLRSNPQALAIVVHARGGDRNCIDIYHDDAITRLQLDGDDRRWLDTPQPDAAQIAALSKLQRAELAERELDESREPHADKR